MKKLLLLLVFAGAMSFRATNLDPISQADRDKLVAELSESLDMLKQTTEGLSAEQYNFRASEGRWSIADCAEHIALAEPALFQWVQSTLQEPADPAKRAEVKVTDEALIKSLPDRSQKFQAPEELKPTGKFGSGEAGVQAFKDARMKTIEYVKTTQDDLRNHFMQHPAAGTMDSYQGMLLLAGHSKRHILQMQEVKADPNFPKQ